MTLSEKMLDGLTLTIVGMGIVMLSLWIIGEIFNFLQRFFAVGQEPKAAPAPAETKTDAADKAHAQLIPILVAAATVAVGRPVAIRRITFLNQDTVSGWAEAGRISIQSSHNLRRSQ